MRATFAKIDDRRGKAPLVRFFEALAAYGKPPKNIGCYIVDFYIATKKIVIELDGVQHGTPESLEKDAERDAYLQKTGITVLRYRNTDIHQKFDDVCRDILIHLNLI